MSKHQDLMDAAYARYGKEMSHEDFLDSLSPAERDAVLLGNLNYQVENGGFSQWVSNGYCLHAKETIRALRRLDTPTANEVISMIDRLVPYIDFSKADRGCMGNYIKRSRYGDDENGEDEFWSIAESLDHPYYAINEQLLADAEAYFERLSQTEG